ncbi:SA1788 family PVL leukocidin-associated protein [Staphylococcus caprae]|uniref:SA1788 family PVL leukocidin-associated protein n=1 Tax=Staphylococcus caprae TaxID=29380 RepID=UPI003395E307
MIVTTINSKGKTYELTDKHIKHMETAGLLTRNVRTRLNDGWLLDDAVQAPMGTRLVDWVQHREAAKEAQLKLERQRQRLEAERRRKKPHLFNVPQKHGRGKWCKHLMENDIFKKVAR